MEPNSLLNWKRIAVLVCVIIYAVLSGRLSAAQHMPLSPAPKLGMIFENDTWRAPTASEGMQMLMTLPDDYSDGPIDSGEFSRVQYILYAVVDQGLEAHPKIDLDAFVSDLIRIWISETGWRRSAAYSAIFRTGFGKYDDGTPYLGVANELIPIYESIDDYPTLNANNVLYLLANGGGINYIWNIFNSTPKPPVCSRGNVLASDNRCPNISPWCDAGKFLIGKPGGPKEEEWKALCEWEIIGEF